MPPSTSARAARRVALLLVAALAAARPARAQGIEREDRYEGGDVLRQRFEYFYGQRQFPFDRMPARLTRADMLRLRAMPTGPRFNLVPSSASAWSALGPHPIAGSNTGRVSAIAVDPRDANVVYVGGAQGGVWKTTDGGATWTPLTDQQCSLAVGAIAISPANPDVVYVGTGEANYSGDSYYGCGILRSTDGGATWTQLGAAYFDTPTGGATFSRIWIDPTSNGATILAATSTGVWRSTDAGASWSRTLNKGYGFASDLVADPADPRTIYAAATSPYSNAQNGIYKSIDGGASFADAPLGTGTGFPTTSVGRIALAVTPAQQGLVLAAVENTATGNLLGVYRTIDGGATWTLAPSAPSCNGQCWYDLTLAIDPANPLIIYLGTVQLYRSTDGGQSFGNVLGSMHVDQHAFVIVPGANPMYYAGNDGGIFRNSTGAAPWQSLNNNLELTQFYAGASLAAGSSLRILGGTQDNGTLEYSGLPTWDAVIGGDGGYTGTDPRGSGVAYGETQWIAGAGYAGPRKRALVGGNFNLQTVGIDITQPGLFISPLVLDVDRPQRLYFGIRSLYRSRDGASTWAPILTHTDGVTSAIAPAPSDSQTVYVATNVGVVRVTHDGGATWQTGFGVPGRFVSDIVVHGIDPNRAWLTVSGFGAAHVYQTVDGGISWTSISGGLPDVPVNSIALLPGGELDVGTDIGIFRTADGGASWTPFIGGLPNVAVVDLVFHRPSSTLVAATHGRGMWQSTLSIVAPPTALYVDRAPPLGASGAPLSAIAVSVREASGYPVATASNTVTARVASGSGTLRGTTTVSAVNGVATFDGLIVDGTGSVSLAFDAAGLTSAATGSITLAPPPTLTFAVSRHATMILGQTSPTTDSAAVTLVGVAGPVIQWSATRTAAWTTLSAASGVGNGWVRWARSANGLAAGTYVDTIALTALGATGSPATLLDTLLVLPAVPATVALLAPDTLRGLAGTAAATDLTIDMSGAYGLTLRSVTVGLAWDSTVVRLDSVSRRDLGAPTVAILNAASARVAAASASSAGVTGTVAAARLHFHVVTSTAGTAAPITLTPIAASSGTDLFDLTPGFTTRSGVVLAASVLRGDVDGDGQVTAADARLILTAVTGLALPAGSHLYPNGDANCDGVVSARDAQVVLAKVNGLATGTACVGTVR